MRNILIAVGCILIVHIVEANSLDEVDQKVRTYPEYHTVKKLADRINSDFSTELEKARAIYYWITHNVSYSFKARPETIKRVRKSYSRKKSRERLERERQDIVADFTMKYRIAVCDGYSTLFKKLADLTNVHCEIVSGFARTDESEIGKIVGANHAWNSILINGEWYLVDSTWGSGNYDEKLRAFIPQFEGVYFMISPELLFLSHYPVNPRWLLISKTKDQFKELPLYSGSFLRLGIEILAPTKGILEIADQGPTFKIILPENLTFNELSYRYNTKPYSSKMKFQISGNSGMVTIPAPDPDAAPSFLHIYYNQEMIVTYKLL